MHRLGRRDARRLAVRAQLLEAERPADLITVVRRLTMLQLDPVSAVAPSADLVAWSRLGSRYAPADLRAHLDDHRLIELAALIRPAEDVVLYRAEMQQWREGRDLLPWQERVRSWVVANDRCRRDILARLGDAGPLSSRDLPDTCEVPWRSTGWTNSRNVGQMLTWMEQRGEVAVAGRRGRDRLWDLAERIHPDLPTVPLEEAARERNRRRLRALGIARSRTSPSPVEPWDVEQAGEPAVVEGVKGEWRVDPELLDLPLPGRTALLSPFDRLVHDRARAEELFGFEYALEMYKPAAARRWGYYALPVLHGDRLIGKLDATADRRAGVLVVNAVHEDEPFDSDTAAAVDAEITGLAAWLGLEVRRAA